MDRQGFERAGRQPRFHNLSLTPEITANQVGGKGERLTLWAEVLGGNMLIWVAPESSHWRPFWLISK